MSRLLDILDREIDYLFFRRFVSWREVMRHHRVRYSRRSPRAVNTGKMVVFMADGFRRLSGLADRLRGIVSLYGYCLDNCLDFRIYFTHPFELQKYMQPVSHDWRISADELCWNSRDARAFHLVTVNNDNRRREVRYQRRRLAGCLGKKRFRQFHVYTAFDCEDQRFAMLFRRLFRPAPEVRKVVDEVQSRLGKQYISVSTRFMELLGDFVEPKQARVTLSDEMQRKLMDKCVDAISKLSPSGTRVLLTSDSNKFLNYASSKLSFVESIDGDICHISVQSDNRESADLKTFADFFAIAEAETSYLLLGPDMYNSNFSRRAAQSSGRELIVVNL